MSLWACAILLLLLAAPALADEPGAEEVLNTHRVLPLAEAEGQQPRAFENGQVVYRAGEAREIRVGVLAKRGVGTCVNEWRPTVDYLTTRISGYRFLLVPLGFDAVEPAVRERQIDFLITNPSQYAELDAVFGLSASATLRNLRMGEPYSVYGSVIFTASARSDIRTIHDLQGQRFAAVDEHSFGGWRMAWLEMRENGIRPLQDFSHLEFAGTHDAVIASVLAGRADGGSVRTDMLERMQDEGLLDADDLRVLHQREASTQVPFVRSTALYPEWPFAVLPHVPAALGKEVARAMISMPATSEAAQAAHCEGWTIPASYQVVHDCLRQLQVGPYQDIGAVSWRLLLRRYWPWLLLGMLILLAAVSIAVLMLRLHTRVVHMNAVQSSYINIGQLILHGRDPGTLLGDICRALTADRGYFNAWAILFDESGRITASAQDGIGDAFQKLLEQYRAGTPNACMCHAQDSHTLRVVSDPAATCVHCPLAGKYAGRAGFSIALSVGGKPFGVLAASVPKVFANDGDERALFASLAGSLAQGLEGLRLSNALRESEQRFKALHNASFGGIAIHDKGVILECNQGLSEISGYSYEELIGKNGLLLISERTRGEVIRNIDNGYESAYEAEGVRKSGERYPLRLEARNIRYKGKDVRVVEFRDITERKRAEAELEEKTQLLQLISDNMFDLVSLADLEGNYVFASASHHRMGYCVEDLLGKNALALVHPEDLSGISAVFEDFVSKRDDGRKAEFRYRCADGSYVWLETIGKILRDKSGNPQRVIFSSRDMTERKKMEEARHEIMQLLYGLLDNVRTVAVQGYTFDGTVRYWNRASEMFYGYTADEAIGKNLLDLIIPPAARSAVQAEIQTMVDSGVAIPSAELELMHKNGSLVPVYSSHTIVQVPGQAPMMFCIDTDLSEIKESGKKLVGSNRALQAATERAKLLAAEAERANEAKSEFLATMSHEIRTPMNGVLGMMRVLLDTNLTAEQRRYAEVVVSSGESLLTIINDILDFSKIEAGKMELDMQAFDMHEMLEPVTHMMQEPAQAKGLAFCIVVDPDVPSVVLGDPVRLRQILLNLTSNAVKFTEAGEVVLRVERLSNAECRMPMATPGTAEYISQRPTSSVQRLTSDSPPPVWLRFSVRDTGIGIPADRQKRLFQTFSQVDGSITRKYGGTGLGLAISKQLVDLMGGEIGVVSAEGKGAEFWCAIPLQETAGQLTLGFAEKAQQAVQNGFLHRQVRLLLVEDDPTNRAVAQEVLKMLGLTQVDIAVNGVEAVAAVQTGLYDLVLMDVSMPEMDGLEATRQIRNAKRDAGNVKPGHEGKRTPENPLTRFPFPVSRVPIIAMTAHTMQEDMAKCLEAGMDDYVSKPISPDTIATVLARWLPEDAG